MCNWLKQSNRLYHMSIGFIVALLGTLSTAFFVALAMEGKDCQYDKRNSNLPPWKWNYEHLDWLDVAATMLGGVMADVLRVGLFLIIYYSVR